MSEPRERLQTIRDQLHKELCAGWVTARQLSTLVGISEKAVPAHLEHLRKSASGAGERFEVEPAVCNKCDYSFEERERLTRPTRCPKCKGERIDPPRFRIVPLTPPG
jgi:predicted Zn-ribbon and HTH transcriptional regulator